MGQKVHPIGFRLGKTLKWNLEWYSKNKLISPKLVYNTYQLRYLLIAYFYKKDWLVHSFSLKCIDDFLFMNINIIPTYTFHRYLYIKPKMFFWLTKKIKTFRNKVSEEIDSFKKKLHEEKSTKRRLILNKIKSKSLLKIGRRFLIFKNSLLKYSWLPFYKYYHYLINFYDYKSSDTKSFIKIKYFEDICKSIYFFQKFPNIVIKINNIGKVNYITNSFLKRFVKNYNYNLWFYYFYIMNKTFPSALLVASILKKVLEKRSLKKKQRFFLKSLRRFLNRFKNDKNIFKYIKGIKIYIKGRLNGRDRASIYKIQVGSISGSMVMQKIDYVFIPIFTIYGSFGIKVWIALNKNVST